MRVILLPRGSTKINYSYPKRECPVCGKGMSKKAHTCMPCYRKGYGIMRNSSASANPRFNKDVQQKWREKVEQLKRENVIKHRRE
jgi:hypothetical protein